MDWIITRAGPDDAPLLVAAGADVFDHDVTPEGAAAFLADPSQVMVIATGQGRLLGFASGAFVGIPTNPCRCS